MIEITPQYLASQGLSENFPSRFWEKIEKTDSCWLWISKALSNGYGIINTGVDRVLIKSNRAAWILCVGSIPSGLCVLHNCPNGDNRKCCNPEHLWLGTKADNVADAVKKGTHPHGETNGHSIFTWDQIFKIRQQYTLDKLSLTSLANLYETNLSTIYNIVKMRSWTKPPLA